MDVRHGDHGTPNPKAPPELAQFAFLIGEFTCDIRLKGEDGAWQPYQATWSGRYILDGYVIADEYRMTTPSGDLVLLGTNFRSYNTEKRTWVLRWLNATGAFWLEMASPEFGGVSATDRTITLNFIDTFAPDVLSRATFSNISESHFTWRGERSVDQGKTWAEFMKIEAHRVSG